VTSVIVNLGSSERVLTVRVGNVPNPESWQHCDGWSAPWRVSTMVATITPCITLVVANSQHLMRNMINTMSWPLGRQDTHLPLDFWFVTLVLGKSNWLLKMCILEISAFRDNKADLKSVWLKIVRESWSLWSCTNVKRE